MLACMHAGLEVMEEGPIPVTCVRSVRGLDAVVLTNRRIYSHRTPLSTYYGDHYYSYLMTLAFCMC